ncbi:MAG TPA: PilZ domain-containing protein [Steroidobacteraceae bacterium]|nr:PilZ domain-containing protein [Steroidobacteraceae bacterium]
MEAGRTETRWALNAAARVHGSGVPPVVDIVWIENISSHGARIHSRRAWKPQDHMVLIRLQGDVQVGAKVIYCQRLGVTECAIGLKFDHPVAPEQLA